MSELSQPLAKKIEVEMMELIFTLYSTEGVTARWDRSGEFRTADSESAIVRNTAVAALSKHGRHVEAEKMRTVSTPSPGTTTVIPFKLPYDHELLTDLGLCIEGEIDVTRK